MLDIILGTMYTGVILNRTRILTPIELILKGEKTDDIIKIPSILGKR